MPLGFGRHSNRSQQALDDSQSQRTSQSGGTGTPTQAFVPSEDKAPYETRTSQPQNRMVPPRRDSEQQRFQPTTPSNELGGYQEQAERPARSQSQRFSAYGQPPSQFQTQGTGQLDDQAAGDLRKSYSTSGTNSRVVQQQYQSQGQQPQQQQQQGLPDPKKGKAKGFFTQLSSKYKSINEPPAQSSSEYGHTVGLARKASKSQKEPPPQLRAIVQDAHDRQQQRGSFQQGQSASPLAPSPREGDEGDGYEHQQSEGDFDHQNQFEYETHQQQSAIRRAPTFQDSPIRAAGEGLAQQQQYVNQQQRAPLFQHHQQHSGDSVSAEDLGLNEYQNITQQNQHYQSPISINNQAHTSLPSQTAQNAEVISQLSRDSLIDSNEERPPSSTTSAQAIAGSALPPGQPDQQSRQQSMTDHQSQTQQGTMLPPGPPSQQNRRPADAKQALSGGDTREAPPGYQRYNGQGQVPSQGQQSQSPSGSGSLPSLPGPGPAGGSFRQSGLHKEFGQPGSGEQGRNTPPLLSDRSGDGDVNKEREEYARLVVKYKKVKGLYFERQSQVEQLQNTLANQRLSQSRTSLDDSEYATRFTRLDGAIKEIAFSIRKDWKTIPRWLSPYVNIDAQKLGTKEMTPVGRATISRWLFDEIFMKCFHPGLDPRLSADLKRIEQNIRDMAARPATQEEADALTAKVVQWRLATIDGLADHLIATNHSEAKAQFIQRAVTNLTAHLLNHLHEAEPHSIEGSATSIIELAVGIASHLPRESRDISITYPLPGDIVQPTVMRIEGPLPPLENPGSEDAETGNDGLNTDSNSGESKSEGLKLKKSERASPAPANVKRAATSDSTDNQSEGALQRVRYAGFMGVEVRGRQWLCGAPVWTMS